jgi:hypothetical protein
VRTFTFKLISVVAIASLFCSCGKKELDRETAMRLLQGRVVRQVTYHFSGFDGSSQTKSAYQELVNAGILACDAPNFFGQRLCHPSSTSGIATDFTGVPQFSAGTIATAAVTGVTQTGPNSATANVQLSFQAAPLYVQHQAAFDAVYAQENGQPMSALTQPGAIQAAFQRYDDGWRFQGFQ